MATRRIVFLPGASGDGGFWRPVADRLPAAWDKKLLDWPGLGDVPAEPAVKSFSDLVRLVLDEATRTPIDVVAQSMGGVVAVLAALERPHAVRRLVLAATSAGAQLAVPDIEDWRPAYRRRYPRAASWIHERGPDLTAELPAIHAPVLLVWADRDPISPISVGRHLARLLRNSQLVVVRACGHTFARDAASEVAPHIERHLGAGEG